MAIVPIIHLHDPRRIRIDRDSRQRKVFTIDDLVTSFREKGQISPILIRPLTKDEPDADKYDGVLIAGERRTTTFLEHPEFGQIMCIYTTEISEADAKELEFEENAKRQDLSWPELAAAILEIHELHVKASADWTLAKTGERLGYDYNSIYRLVEVGKELRKGNDKVEAASGWKTAYQVIETQRERQRESATAKLQASIAEDFATTDSYTVEDVQAIQTEAKTGEGQPETPPPAPPEKRAPILNTDAIKFMDDYRGVPFNFGHLDFPYGINIDDADQVHAEAQGIYADSPEVYWELMAALCRNRDRLFSPSTHIMHWFSPKLYRETLDFFEKNAPDFWVQDIPLVWLKTDNAGIMADARRRPRNITEMAFLISRGDRKLVNALANGYGAPSTRVIHPSEKPVPVLRHYFKMFLDENSRMIDPTSGSANSLIAALDFNVDSMLGVEKDPEFYERSVQAFKKAQTLKDLANG